LLLRSTEIPPHRPNDLLPPFPLHTPGSQITVPSLLGQISTLHFMPRTPGSTHSTLGQISQHWDSYSSWESQVLWDSPPWDSYSHSQVLWDSMGVVTQHSRV